MEISQADLEGMEVDTILTCPWCEKSRVYVYGAEGQISQQCINCRNYILWNFDEKKGYRISAKKMKNR